MVPDVIGILVVLCVLVMSGPFRWNARVAMVGRLVYGIQVDENMVRFGENL